MRSFMLLIALVAAAPAMASPRSFSVEVQGSGPPVILIPGLACGGAVWDSTVARYKKSHQLHVLTLAGFAGRKPIDAPLLPSVRSELASYIREHKLVRPVIVGHSLGGFLAVWLAATEPDLVGKVVVVDALPFLAAAEMPATTVEQVKPRAQMMRDMIAKSPPEQFAAQNHAAIVSMVTDAKNVEPLAEMGKKSDQASVAAAMYELMTTDLRPLLGKVRAPTLVLAAAEDADTEKTFAAQYASLPSVKIVPVKARHFIFLDNPTAFFAAMDGVLK
jgi:pimeloyl-ACP methyl ester carboxylesterase